MYFMGMDKGILKMISGTSVEKEFRTQMWKKRCIKLDLGGRNSKAVDWAVEFIELTQRICREK